jgi:predicted adenine nucleotide alpha hydrolase (AANH) superfamily ATPase
MEQISVTVYFYNPNIHPVTEYLRRKAELKAYLETINIPYLDDDHDWQADVKRWFKSVKGLEWSPEKSRRRCEPCINMRLEKTAVRAKLDRFDSFSTTLSVSPHKDATQINRLGQLIASREAVPFIDADFKIEGGYQRSLALSQQNKLYRQSYCGCVFSRLERKRYVKIKG